MRVLKLLPLAMCLLLAFASLWIVAPAPAAVFWLVAVVMGEFGLFAAALTALAMLASWKVYARNSISRRLSTAVGCAAILAYLYPTVSAWRSVHNSGVQLSMREYAAGPFEPLQPARAGSHVFADVAGQKLQLDEYRPAVEASARRTAVIVVHGGSWNSGKRSDFPKWDRWLAGLGYTVFDIDYRISPQPNVDAATNDVLCAVSWVRRNAVELKVVPERIVLFGRSAGGHLALLAGYTSQQRSLTCGNNFSENASAPVQAVIAFYAPTDLPWSYDHPANQRVLDGPATLRKFIGSGPHDSAAAAAAYRRASPAYQVTSSTPPTFLAQGGKDQLVRTENAKILDRKLSADNVLHETVIVPYAQHGFDYAFNGWGSQIVKSRLLDFLNRLPR